MNEYGLIRQAAAAALIAALAGCASSPAHAPALAVIDQPGLRNLAEADGLSLPQPLLAGGVWLDDRPLLVNRPFDMSLALTVPMAGPAIAAGVRRRENNERAALIAETDEPDPAGAFCGALSEGTCHAPSDADPANLAAFALLYGGERGRLITVVQSTTEPVRHVVIVSPLRPMQETAGAWLADNAELLNTQIRTQARLAAQGWISVAEPATCKSDQAKRWRIPALADLSVTGCTDKQSPSGYRWIRDTEGNGYYALPGDATGTPAETPATM